MESRQDGLKRALDGIIAEDCLKTKTIASLEEKIKREKVNTFVRWKRLTIVFAVVICFITGGYSYNLYFVPCVYIDLDINPSIQIALNKFDRVITVYAYNQEGEDLLSISDIKNKKYDVAVEGVLDAMAQKGYLGTAQLLSVTVQTENTSHENILLDRLKYDVENIVQSHHSSSSIEVYSVTGEIKKDAHDLDLSPAKYLAILELQKLNPDATIEECRGHSIGELREEIEEHQGDHHDGGNEDHDEDH